MQKSYNGRTNLQYHIKIVHEKIEPFKCLQCEKIYIIKTNLQVHIKIFHEKIKPFNGQQCEKSFGQKSALTIHNQKFHALSWKTFSLCLWPSGCQQSLSGNVEGSNAFSQEPAVHRQWNIQN